MSKSHEIDRSLVAIFDIEAFTRRNPPQQAQLVNQFIESLQSHLEGLSDLNPDAFSTGDGAIVSIGRACTIDSSNTQRFIRFAISFTLGVIAGGLSIRTAVNYSERDRVLSLTESANIRGSYIQIGDTINIATRILSFCEPREIMISQAVADLMRRLDLSDMARFQRNEPLITKHEEMLYTYTYVPLPEESEYLYGPDSPIHPYKRFSNFPPIKGPTLKYFMDIGLDHELTRVVSNAYEAMRHINDTMTFMSWRPVLSVLMALRYDPEDTVYVLSRNDHSTGFWTQSRKNQYVGYLDANAAPYGGYINQTRVMVYDDSRIGGSPVALPDELMSEDDIFYELRRLHNTKTYFSFPRSGLDKYARLCALQFGFTLSTKHKYAIVPIPAPEDIDASRLDPRQIEVLLERYPDYDMADGPMKAIVTADEKYVAAIVADMNALLDDTRLILLK